MKKVNLLLAAVVAASVAAPSFAATVDTYGYFRMNANQAKGGKMTKYQVSNVGRLGNENDNYGEFGARVQFAKVDDTSWNFQGTWALLGDDSQGQTEKSIENKEAFVSVTGLFDWDKDAELWAGRRFLRQYVVIADWYYADYSGNGTGINNLQVGPGKASVFWSRAKQDNDYAWNAGKQYKEVTYIDANGKEQSYTAKQYKEKKYEGKKYVDYFNAEYIFGLWDGAELLIKDTYGVVSRQSGIVHSEKEIGNNNRLNIELHVGGANYWNGTSLEWFHGSNVRVDTCGGCWEDPQSGAKSANAYRLINQGNVKFNNTFGLEHVVSYAYATGYDDDYEYKYNKDFKVDHVDKVTLAKAVVRPTLKLTKMTRLVAELGAFKKVTKTNGKDSDKITETGEKATLAYCITPSDNVFVGPAIKFFVTYIHGDNHSDNEGRLQVNGITSFDEAYPDVNHNVMFGVQAEGWW